MKKALQFTLALLLCFTLTACVETTDTKVVEENTALLEQVETLEATLAEKEAECQGHEEELETLQAELAAHQLAAEEAAAQTALLEEQAAQLEALQTENADLQQRAEELEAQNQTLAAAGAAAAATATGGVTAQAAAQDTPEPAATSVTVWIPRTGAKYHSTSTCSNMKNPGQSTEEDAIARGYGKCSKCW